MDADSGILARLAGLEPGRGWRFERMVFQRDLPIFRLHRGGARPDAARLYLSAGIHGDEPAGPLALIELIEEGFDFAGVEVEMFPLLNPDGLRAGSRTNINGVDLNRDYRGPRTDEVRAHVEAIARLGRIDLALCLHEDWEAQGNYIYELNSTAEGRWGAVLLAAMSAHIPADPRREIDGMRAEGGLIRPVVRAALRPDWPEAIYLWERVCPLVYTLETPSERELERRCAAHKAGVRRAAEVLAGGSW